MNKKFLAMMSALILTITCIAPLNVKAALTEPSEIYVNLKDQDGNIVRVCSFQPGQYQGVGCGHTWSNNTWFEQYELFMIMDVPSNYTIEATLQLKLAGLINGSGGANPYFTFADSKGAWRPFSPTDYVYHEYFHNHESYVVSSYKFTNNTGVNPVRINFTYTNYGGNYIDYTLLTIQKLSFNIYDEQGRLFQKIENGVNLLHTDLGNINTNISNQISSLKTNITNNFNTLISNLTTQFNNLNNWIKTQTTEINKKLDDVIAAIRGDDKDVDSKDEVDNTTNDLDNTINEYEDIENTVVDDFNNNFGSIKPNNDLITNNDFINTSTFVAAQMTRIYESNSIIKMTITFGLIIGLAFTVIGISVRR